MEFRISSNCNNAQDIYATFLLLLLVCRKSVLACITTVLFDFRKGRVAMSWRRLTSPLPKPLNALKGRVLIRMVGET